jgi:hypothetical protein
MFTEKNPGAESWVSLKLRTTVKMQDSTASKEEKRTKKNGENSN